MKFIGHRSSLFHLPANYVALTAYLLLSVGVGLPIVNNIAVFICLFIFVFEHKSYMVQFQAMQASFVAMLIEVLRGAGVFAISWGWQSFGWQDGTIHLLMSILIYGLMILQALIAVYGSVKAMKWQAVVLPGIGPLSDWILGRSTVVKKEEYLDNSGKDGVSLKKKL